MGAAMSNNCCYRDEIKDDDNYEHKGTYNSAETPKDFRSNHVRSAKKKEPATPINLELQDKDPEEFHKQLKLAIELSKVRLRDYHEGEGYRTLKNPYDDEFK